MGGPLALEVPGFHLGFGVFLGETLASHKLGCRDSVPTVAVSRASCPPWALPAGPSNPHAVWPSGFQAEVQ